MAWIAIAAACGSTAIADGSAAALPPPSIDQDAGETGAWPIATLAVAAVGGLLLARRLGLFARPRRALAPGPLPGESLLLLAVGLYAVGPVAYMSASALGLAPPDPATATRGQLAQGAAIAYLAQGALALVVLRRACAPAPAGTWREHAGTGVLALACAWPAAAMLAILVGLMLVRFGYDAPTVAHDTLRTMVEGPKDGAFVALAVMVTIAAPIVEETLYRGLLQTTLVRFTRSRAFGLVATSVLFAAMHFTNTAPHGLVALFVISLGFGWAYERSGSLRAPILAHALFNAGNLALAHL